MGSPRFPCPLPTICRDQRCGGATEHFYKRPLGINQGNGRKKEENSPAQIAASLRNGCLQIERTNEPPKHEKANYHSRYPKIDLKLHHIAHTKRRCRRKVKAGHLRDDLRTTGKYRLLGPEGARNQREYSLPDRSAHEVIHLALVNSLSCQSDKIVLIE